MHNDPSQLTPHQRGWITRRYFARLDKQFKQWRTGDHADGMIAGGLDALKDASLWESAFGSLNLKESEYHLRRYRLLFSPPSPADFLAQVETLRSALQLLPDGKGLLVGTSPLFPDSFKPENPFAPFDLILTSVSRVHFSIARHESKWLVADLNSKDGTEYRVLRPRVRDRKLTPVATEIEPGTTLVIAKRYPLTLPPPGRV